jgi:hypothetical protein
MAYTCCLWREGGSEWVSEWRQFSNLSAISWRKQVYHQWDDDEVRCVHPKTIKLFFCCFSTKHAAWRRKSKGWLARNQNNVSEWSVMSTHRLLFRWASTIKSNSACWWFRANQPLLFLLHAACLVEKQQKNSFIVFGLILPGLEHTIYARNQNNVSEWSVMSTHRLLFRWASTIKSNSACWSSTQRTSSSSHWW